MTVFILECYDLDDHSSKVVDVFETEKDAESQRLELQEKIDAERRTASGRYWYPDVAFGVYAYEAGSNRIK